MKPDCIDFEERFGRRYRLQREDDGATWFETPADERKWLLEIPCKHGLVYPYGGDVLAAVAMGRQRMKVRRLPFLLSRRGDEELVVTFHVDHVEDVLALLKPHRRRQISAAERERLRAIGSATRFAGVQSAQRAEAATHGEKGSPESQPGSTDAGNPPVTSFTAVDAGVDEGEPRSTPRHADA